jgi:hypothetical protein
MDRRDTKSLLRDYAIPMQDNTAYSLSYKKDSSKDPRKAGPKTPKVTEPGKPAKTKAWLKDKTGLLKIQQAPAMAKGGKVGNTKDHNKAGGSNTGKYSKSEGPFAGPSGGAPKGSYPIGSKSRGKSALKLAHNAPNPSGIKNAVYRKYPDLKSEAKKAMEGAKLGLGGMGQLQDKAPQPTKRNAPADKVKQNFALYKRKVKVYKPAYGH